MSATLKSRLPMIAAEILPRVSAAVKETAEAIAEGAQERVPRDTEDLYYAIHVERVGAGEYVVLAGDEDVFYGHLVEFGTQGSAKHHATAAKPFLIPAKEAETPFAEARVTAVLRGL